MIALAASEARFVFLVPTVRSSAMQNSIKISNKCSPPDSIPFVTGSVPQSDREEWLPSAAMGEIHHHWRRVRDQNGIKLDSLIRPSIARRCKLSVLKLNSKDMERMLCFTQDERSMLRPRLLIADCARFRTPVINSQVSASVWIWFSYKWLDSVDGLVDL